MLITTNKMQHNTIFFIAVRTLHFSSSFPAHHQELKNCKYSIWYLLSLVVATPSIIEMELRSISTMLGVPDAVLTVFELLMMGGETA
jgi:hypothetical protein